MSLGRGPPASFGRIFGFFSPPRPSGEGGSVAGRVHLRHALAG